MNFPNLFKYLTWDSGIIAALIILVAYSLLLRKDRALSLLVSIYIGYLVADGWGLQLAEFLSGQRVLANQLWINADVSPFMVQTVVMITTALLISIFVKLGGKRGRYAAHEVFLYALATIVVGVAFMIRFMSPEMLAIVTQSSQIVATTLKFQGWLVLAPVLIMIFFGIYGNDDV